MVWGDLLLGSRVGRVCCRSNEAVGRVCLWVGGVAGVVKLQLVLGRGGSSGATADGSKPLSLGSGGGGAAGRGKLSSGLESRDSCASPSPGGATSVCGSWNERDVSNGSLGRVLTASLPGKLPNTSRPNAGAAPSWATLFSVASCDNVDLGGTAKNSSLFFPMPTVASSLNGSSASFFSAAFRRCGFGGASNTAGLTSPKLPASANGLVDDVVAFT